MGSIFNIFLSRHSAFKARRTRLAQILAMLAIAAIFVAPSCAQKPLDNNEIVKMHASGLSDPIILATINSQAGTYATSADDLIALRKAGISDTVISAILSKNSGATSSAGVQPAAAQATAPVSYQQGGQWVPILPETFEEKSSGGMKVLEMKLPDINGRLHGTSSTLKLAPPVTLRVALPEGVQFGDCELIKFRVAEDYRQFHLLTGGFNKPTRSRQDAVQFDAKKIDAHTYEITLPTDIPPGEYGLYLTSTVIYTFSIAH